MPTVLNELEALAALATQAPQLVNLKAITNDFVTVADAVKDLPTIAADASLHATAQKISADWRTFETDADGVIHAKNFLTKLKDLSQLPGAAVHAGDDAISFINSPELSAAITSTVATVQQSYADLISRFNAAKGLLTTLEALA